METAAKTVARKESPGRVTPGQKTVYRRDQNLRPQILEGFQSQFLDPSVPGQDEGAGTQDFDRGWGLDDPRQGVFMGVDWAAISFRPEVMEPGKDGSIENDIEQGEFDLDDELIPNAGTVEWVRIQGPPHLKERFEQHLDVTVNIERERRLRDQVQLAMSVALQCDIGDWIDLPYGLPGYHNAISGPDGSRIDFDPTDTSRAKRFTFRASMPGKACARAGETRMKRYFNFAITHGGKATRIDLAIDDYGRVISLDDLEAVTKGPEFVKHIKEVKSMTGWEAGKPDCTGQTLYMGSNASRRKARVYDKYLESGEKDCNRWELEEKKEGAHQLMVQLTEKGANWKEIFQMRLVSFIDFRKVDSHSEVENRERLAWYQVLVDNIKKGQIYPAEIVKTIDQFLAWFESNMVPSFALAVAAVGGDMARIHEWAKTGKERWKPRQKTLALSI